MKINTKISLSSVGSFNCLYIIFKFHIISYLLHQVKTLSQYSKPWWKWVNHVDLAILRYEKTSHLRRCSLPLAKARLDSNNRSILRKSSLNRVVDGDYCVGGRVHAEEHLEKQMDCNGIGDDIAEKTPNTNNCDYSYKGYTLEISDKVRIINIFDDKKKEDVDDISPVRANNSDTNLSRKSDNSMIIKPKQPKRVQFWGLSRD